MQKKRLFIVLLPIFLVLSAGTAFAFPFAYEITEQKEIVTNPDNPNKPECLIDNCKTCMKNVDCAFLGQAGCTDGESWKTDTLMNFEAAKALQGEIHIIGGEGVRCSINDQLILQFGVDNYCGAFRKFLVPAEVLATNASNELKCSVRGWGTDEDNGFRLSYLALGIDSHTNIGMLSKNDREKALGQVKNLVGDSTEAGKKGWSATVESKNEEVMVWVGTATDYERRKTKDANDGVWACADSDKNNECDYEQKSQSCEDEDGDWYKGECCGLDYKDCEFAPDLNALCGQTPDGWAWAAVGRPGEIHTFTTCIGGDITSDGSDLYTCGGQLSPVAKAFGNNPINVKVSDIIHQYICTDAKISECAGEALMAFSKKPKILGTAMGTDPVYYCANDSTWTTDLDTKNRESCEAAGFKWTGSLCCSEADDPNEYYNDPAENAIGGCWNKDFVSTAEFAAEPYVLNYKGTFMACMLDDPAILALTDTHTGGKLIRPEKNYQEKICDSVLAGGGPAGKGANAICTPAGWDFTDAYTGKKEKTIKWDPNIFGVDKTGCCAKNDCWNGTTCVPLESFYRVLDRGFVCEE